MGKELCGEVKEDESAVSQSDDASHPEDEHTLKMLIVFKLKFFLSEHRNLIRAEIAAIKLP